MLIRDWLAVKVEVTGIPCAPECCAHRDFDKLTSGYHVENFIVFISLSLFQFLKVNIPMESSRRDLSENAIK